MIVFPAGPTVATEQPHGPALLIITPAGPTSNRYFPTGNTAIARDDELLELKELLDDCEELELLDRLLLDLLDEDELTELLD